MIHLCNKREAAVHGLQLVTHAGMMRLFLLVHFLLSFFISDIWSGFIHGEYSWRRWRRFEESTKDVKISLEERERESVICVVQLECTEIWVRNVEWL